MGAREGHIFHNRLTHTLKVAQLSQRLAERFHHVNASLAEKLNIDVHVAEAAALAHDLGHPPYGHVAEVELCRLVDEGVERRAKYYKSTEGQEASNKGLKEGCSDGFEGNAQSFRIVTRLAAHKPHVAGLNLSRGTLNAILKYPWYRELEEVDEKKHAKWGAYRSDRRDFDFARAGLPPNQRTVEAEIMDVADDIAYSVHDLDDFVKAGLIPLADLLFIRVGPKGEPLPGGERSRFLEWWTSSKFAPDTDIGAKEIDTLFDDLRDLYGDQAYRGAYHQRGLARRHTSRWIQELMEAVTLQDPEKNEGKCLSVREPEKVRMEFLKGLVWFYVIESGRLATQRHGQRRIVRELFLIYLHAACKRDAEAFALVPNRFSAQLAEAERGPASDVASDDELGLAADIVASFTDSEAGHIFHKLTGVSLGSVTEVVEA